ncbi:hypothetical protein [Pendulispora albinea]|uniref:Uncharacterized protein n=1 Tax=Pendulispora albinea TaxID=2741071 RepID=A0ABZ2LJI6_9BACT
MSGARADYEIGAAAYDRRDFGKAAIYFARADERAPNPRALQLAMAAALRGPDPEIAMELVDRAESRGGDGAVSELARRLRKRFTGSIGKVRIVCPEDIPCWANVDNSEKDVAGGHTVWVMPGKHVMHVQAEKGSPIDREFSAVAGTSTDVKVSASELVPPTPLVQESEHVRDTPLKEVAPTPLPAPPPPKPALAEPPPRSHKLPPAYFWSALGATGAAAITSTVLTVITKNRYDDYVANPITRNADDGAAAQNRARIAWGVTGAFAATTIVLAVLTDFHARPKSERVGLAVSPSSVLVVGRFK